MTWDSRIQAVAAILSTLGLMWAAVRSFRRSQREQAQRIAADKQDTYNRGVIDGQHARDDEVRQLMFERDDARSDRDLARRDAEDWKNRYLDLQDRRGP